MVSLPNHVPRKLRPFDPFKKLRVTLFLFLLLAPHATFAQSTDGILSTRPHSFITDTANVLSALEEEELENNQAEFQQTTGVEIAVVTLETTEGLPIEDIALEIGRRWGVGGSGDRGVVIVFAKADREARIEVGYGLEGEIPDIVAKAILEEVMLPSFREGEYGRGLTAGVEAIMQRFQETQPQSDPVSRYTSIPVYQYTFFLLFLFLEWLLIILARTKSWWLGGVIGAAVGTLVWLINAFLPAIPLFAMLGLLLDYAVSRNYRRRGPTAWWAGGNWGPGGRGGFRGFSGGSFGGGGATGRF